MVARSGGGNGLLARVVGGGAVANEGMTGCVLGGLKGNGERTVLVGILWAFVGGLTFEVCLGLKINRGRTSRLLGD